MEDESSESDDHRDLRSGTRHHRLPKGTMSKLPINIMSTANITVTTSHGTSAGPQLTQGAMRVPLKVLSAIIDVVQF